MTFTLYELALKLKSEGFADAKKNLAGIDAQGKGVATRLGGISKALTGVAAAAAAVAVGKFLQAAIKESTEAEAVLSDLRQAVNNVGGDFEKLRPAFDEAATGMQKFTRFSDDATRGALARMVLISNDTAGSLKNVGLAADIAAARHIDLEKAAAIVAKTMTGNTRGLKEFGIETKDADEALDQLRTKFRGFAEADGKTFQGRLEQIRNAWAEVLEATGNAITGADNAAESMVFLRDKLLDLAKYIDQNGAKWRGWASDILEVVRALQSVGSFLIQVKARIESVSLAWHSLLSGGKRGLFRDVTGGGSTAGSATAPAPVGGHSTPSPRMGGGGKAAKDTAVRIPGFDFSGGAELQMETLFDKIDAAIDDMFKPKMEETAESLAKIIGELKDKIISGPLDQFRKEMAESISQGFANTLGDAIYNAFAAAFNGEGIGGIIGAFGKTILAGVGGMMTQLGMVYLQYGVLMTGLASLLPNPFTAGPAGIAIGAALIAMGAALGAVATGGSRGGSPSAARFGGMTRGTTEITRLKFVDRPSSGSALVPMAPVIINAYGPNDPKTQRWMEETLAKSRRR